MSLVRGLAGALSKDGQLRLRFAALGWMEASVARQVAMEDSCRRAGGTLTNAAPCRKGTWGTAVAFPGCHVPWRERIDFSIFLFSLGLIQRCDAVCVKAQGFTSMYNMDTDQWNLDRHHHQLDENRLTTRVRLSGFRGRAWCLSESRESSCLHLP